MQDDKTNTNASAGPAFSERLGLGPLLDEWAKAAGVTFEERTIGPTLTRSMVARDDLLQLMHAVQAAERERCAKVCESVASDLESAEEDAQAMSIGAQSCADQIRAGA